MTSYAGFFLGRDLDIVVAAAIAIVFFCDEKELARGGGLTRAGKGGGVVFG